MKNDIKNRAQKQFGAHAAAYIGSEIHSNGESLGRLVALTKPLPGSRILDVATGGGHTANTFAQYNETVIATDITFPMLMTARDNTTRQSTGKISFVQHDAEHIPFANNHFDLLTCRIAAHHFPNVPRFIQEAVRVVRPGGLCAVADNVIIGEPDIANFVNTLEKLRDPSHCWAYSLEDWDSFFFSAGLKVTHKETIKKEIDLAPWATRMGVLNSDLTRLHALLHNAPDRVRKWLNIKENGQRVTFTLEEGILVGEKPE